MKPLTAEMEDITKLRDEIKHITGLYERSESRVVSLEEERARLEAETKELERSISRSIHEPSSSTSVHRQVCRTSHRTTGECRRYLCVVCVIKVLHVPILYAYHLTTSTY